MTIIVDLNSLKSLREEAELLPIKFEINREELPSYYIGSVITLGGITGITYTCLRTNVGYIDFLKKTIAFSAIAFSGVMIVNYEKDSYIENKFNIEYQPRVVHFKENNSVYEATIKPVLEISRDKLYNKIGYTFEDIHDISDSVQVVEIENFT